VSGIEAISQTARRSLVKDGPEAVSLRAIAREMGMTAPGLYRYFGNYEELVRYLTASIFTELGHDIHQAIEAAVPPAARVSEAGPGDAERAMLTVKMVAACREFRRWSLNHQGEFALVFGVPVRGSLVTLGVICLLAALAFFIVPVGGKTPARHIVSILSTPPAREAATALANAAREIAARAKTRFPVGSPGWVKSDDIASYKPPQSALRKK